MNRATPSTIHDFWKGLPPSFVLVLTAMLLAHAQTTESLATNSHYRSEQVWTFNFPQAPLKISADGDRTYNLRNTTKLAIKAYRLGCVRESSKRNLVIVHRMDVEATTISPGEEWGVVAFHHNLDRAGCERRSAKLTVIEVTFEDGTMWQPSAKVQDD